MKTFNWILSLTLIWIAAGNNPPTVEANRLPSQDITNTDPAEEQGDSFKHTETGYGDQVEEYEDDNLAANQGVLAGRNAANQHFGHAMREKTE